jgi:hypothetical protein
MLLEPQKNIVIRQFGRSRFVRECFMFADRCVKCLELKKTKGRWTRGREKNVRALLFRHAVASIPEPVLHTLLPETGCYEKRGCVIGSKS